MSGSASARHIGAPRVAPWAWHDWLSTHVAPAADPLLRTDQRLVIVAPHPDDEILACALLMQQHAARGGALHLVAVTDGEASHGQSGAAARWLAHLRDSERSAGLARLGLAHIPITRLHLPDSAVAQAGSRLHAALMALLEPGDALLTTWRWDGHPDHECCGRVALDVSRRLGLPLLQAPVWMWHWAAPGSSRVDWPALRALAGSAAQWEAKQAALAAHRSQLLPRSAYEPAVLDDSILERSRWPREYFFV